MRLTRIDVDHYYLKGCDLEIMRDHGKLNWDVRTSEYRLIKSFPSRDEAKEFVLSVFDQYPEQPE